jgi:hypothetical protein
MDFSDATVPPLVARLSSYDRGRKFGSKPFGA